VPASVAWVDALPRNATGKVLKWELRNRFVGADAPAIS
jgi:fatty-acyl-CoA synthase